MTALVSLDDVKSELNKTSTTDDAELEDYIGRASAILLNHPEYRVADAAGVTSYTQDWTLGGNVIVLDHLPVVAVTSVTEYVGGTGTVLASEPITTAAFTGYGYRLDSESGILTRLSGGYPTGWLGAVRVVYTAGLSSVPDDVRDAALNLVRHLWETQRGGGAGRPVVPLDPDFASAPAGVSSYLLPHRVMEALAAYRRGPVIA